MGLWKIRHIGLERDVDFELHATPCSLCILSYRLSYVAMSCSSSYFWLLNTGPDSQLMFLGRKEEILGNIKGKKKLRTIQERRKELEEGSK